LKEIWERYSQERSSSLKHQLMLQYMWLVKYVVHQTSLPMNSILNDEDFVNIGMIGLHEAIDRFEYQRGVKFESYAILRIKGIIQDELRKLDWLSRTVRKKAHEFLQAKDSLSSEVGREVSPEEIMHKLNVSPEKYQSYLQAAAAAKSSLSITESSQVYINDDEEEVDILNEIPDEEDNYLTRVEHTERLDFLTNYLTELNEKKRLVMSLYYYENLTFKEIGSVINVSESRICQIHTQVLKDLRDRLKKYDFA